MDQFIKTTLEDKLKKDFANYDLELFIADIELILKNSDLDMKQHAAAMDISYQTFYKRLNNKAFTLEDIFKILKLNDINVIQQENTESENGSDSHN